MLLFSKHPFKISSFFQKASVFQIRLQTTTKSVAFIRKLPNHYVTRIHKIFSAFSTNLFLLNKHFKGFINVKQTKFPSLVSNLKCETFVVLIICLFLICLMMFFVLLICYWRGMEMSFFWVEFTSFSSLALVITLFSII